MKAKRASRRKQLAAEAEFYGAMDGASRFTQRDAVASILITGINILAGFLIGVLQHGMDLRRAIETYTVLTIGDGLVTVIPALMISVAGGLIVTRAGSEKRLGDEFSKQLFGNAEPLGLASGVLVALALFPGSAYRFRFLRSADLVGTAAWKMRRRRKPGKPADLWQRLRRPQKKTTMLCFVSIRSRSKSESGLPTWLPAAPTRRCCRRSLRFAAISLQPWASSFRPFGSLTMSVFELANTRCC